MQRRHFLMSTVIGSVALSKMRRAAPVVQQGSWPYDGAGSIARLGVLTPDFDPVPESELWAMAPSGVSIHASRVPRAGGSGAGFVAAPYVDEAVDRLAEMAPRAILLGYTSSSYALGREEDERVRARLEERAHGIPFIFPAVVAVTALRQLGARKIALIHPPWWTEKANEQGHEYFSRAGFDVLECARVRPERKFAEVKPSEVFEFVSANVPPGTDAVFIGGNGMRAIGAVGALEAEIKRPVLTANQLLMWEALRRLGRAQAVTRYGGIFHRSNT